MIADEVLSYIENEGLGTSGTDLFLGFQPDETDDCVTFYDETAPVAPESNAIATDQFGVQIIVRNSSYSTARDLMMAIHRKIIGFGGEKLVSGGHDVGSCFILSSPASIGRDDKNRNEWSVHYVFRVESEGDAFRS